MAFDDVREYISALEKQGELIRINQEMDWDLEMAAIARRSYEVKAEAILFEKIKDYPPGYRSLVCQHSNFRRIAISMGLDPEASFREIKEEYARRKKNPIKPIL